MDCIDRMDHTKDNWEDIDRYIQKLQEEQEIKDYLDNGVYPKRLTDDNHIKIYIPELNEKPILEFESINDTIQPKLNSMLDTLNMVEQEIKNTIERENKEINENNCPICLDKLGERNYMVPNCGHRVCITCFVATISSKQPNKDLCCICRKKIE